MLLLRVKAVASHGDFYLVAVLFCPAPGMCTPRVLPSLSRCVALDSYHTLGIMTHVCVGVGETLFLSPRTQPLP